MKTFRLVATGICIAICILLVLTSNNTGNKTPALPGYLKQQDGKKLPGKHMLAHPLSMPVKLAN
jgi:hypothetical protein